MRGQSIMLVILLSGITSPLATLSQHLFDDLPIGDPSRHSALGPHEKPEKKIRDNLFVVAAADPSTCYPGQQVQLTWRLYTALHSTSAIAAKPALSGFMVREGKVDETPLRDSVIGGRHYHGFTVWQVLVTPLQAGTYTIAPLSVSNDVSYTAAGGKPAHYSGPVASNNVAVQVLPLPTAGQPRPFTGLVGKWQVHSRLALPRLDAGGTDSILVEIAGTGNFDNITPPPVRWPAGFHQFDPVQRQDLRDDRVPPTGRKIIAIPFTASVPGKYTLPPMELAYFDPDAARYQVAHADSLSLEVIRPPAGAASSAAASQLPTASLPATVISLLSRLLFPVLFIGAVILLLILRSNRSRPVPPANSPSETDTHEKLNLPQEELYLANLKKDLLTFLRSRLQTDTCSEEELMRLLERKDRILAGKTRPLLDSCNRLLYSPHQSDPGALGELNRQVATITVSYTASND